MITAEEKTQLGNTISKIQNLIYQEYVTIPGLNTTLCKQLFAGSYLQIKDPKVFILQEYYGSPQHIHTYWGKVSLLGSTSSEGCKPLQELMLNLKEKLGLNLIEEGDYEGGSYICPKTGIKMPNKRDHMGFYGPYYQITKCLDNKFECENLLDRKTCYKTTTEKLSYETCKKDLEKFSISIKE